MQASPNSLIFAGSRSRPRRCTTRSNERYMGQLQDKVCIVTGGAGSLGLASARRFVDEGAKVMLVDLHEQQLRSAAAELPANQVAFKVADVGRPADVHAYVDTTLARW